MVFAGRVDRGKYVDGRPVLPPVMPRSPFCGAVRCVDTCKSRCWGGSDRVVQATTAFARGRKICCESAEDFLVWASIREDIAAREAISKAMFKRSPRF